MAGGLECIECGSGYELSGLIQRCSICGGVLTVRYDYDLIKNALTMAEIRSRGSGIWKFLELLPVFDTKYIVSLGEGDTFLHRCERLANDIGVKRLYVKDETSNPTGAFIDRGTTVMVSKAKELGFHSFSCGTTGNLGASLAAYTAKAGFRCTIYLPGRVDPGKLYQMVAYGAQVEPARSYDDAFSKAGEVGRRGYLAVPCDPYFLEGEKTSGYEVCQQLRWMTPDRIIVPVGNGSHLSMIWKSLKELVQVGFLQNSDVKMTGIQAEGCSPIVEAFRRDKKIEEWQNEVNTIASDIGFKKPLMGKEVLRALEESSGSAVAVSDKEILEATRLLAKTEGIFAEPSASSTIAGLKKLIDEGEVDRSEEVVCVITGAGLKDPLTVRRFVEKSKKLDHLFRSVGERRLMVRMGETKLRILEILSDEEVYGYDLWKRLKESYDIDIKVPSVYQHMAQLESLDLIKRIRSQRVLGKPKRHYYRITTRGDLALKSLEELKS